MTDAIYSAFPATSAIVMVGTLLMRGMLVGILAGILSFGFLKVFGEPPVDRAIAYEAALDQAEDKAAVDEAKARGLPIPVLKADEELVSRPVQAGLGLFTGVAIYNTAFGGLFALVFAFAYGRMGTAGPRGTAALLAVAGVIAVYIVPNLKYPANPPSIGNADTIGMRTEVYFAMIAISLAAMIAAGKLRLWLLPKLGGWNAALVAIGAYVIAVGVAGFALPSVNEVPENFPASVLWHFRVASVGAQLIMWSTIGLAFGAWTEVATGRSTMRSAPALR